MQERDEDEQQRSKGVSKRCVVLLNWTTKRDGKNQISVG